MGFLALAIGAAMATAGARGAILALLAVGACGAIGVFAASRIALRPQVGLLVLAALAPYDGLLDIGPSVPLIAAWKEALIAFVLLATFLGPNGRVATAATRHWARRAAWVPIAVGLTVLLSLSLLFRPPVVGLIGLKVALFYAVIPVAAMRAPFTVKDRDCFVTILMVGGGVTTAVGLAQQLVGHERLAELGYRYNEHIRFAGGILRSFSTFNTPFAFAFFLCLVLLICLPVALSDSSRLRNRLFLLALPVMIAALYFTVVRTAVLGLGIGVLTMALAGEQRIRRFVPVLVVAAVVVGGILVASRSGTLSLFSARERGNTLVNTVGDVLDHPLGHGAGSIGAAAERSDVEMIGRDQLAAETAAGRESVIPDNQYLTWAYTLGVAGLWLFVRMLCAFVATASRALRRSTGDDAALARGLVAYFVAVVVWCFFANALEIFPIDLLTWLLVALATSLSLRTSTDGAPRPAKTADRVAVHG